MLTRRSASLALASLATLALTAACAGKSATADTSAAAAAPPAAAPAATPAAQVATTAAATTAPTGAATGATPIRVYKDASCGCCKSWIAHMQQNGFQVTAIDEPAPTLDSIKQAHGITDATASCHTAEVGNYVIEGHVPADLVQKLVREKPAGVVGLSVPGMVTGSPGMEGPNPQHYTVVALMKDGSTRPYAQR